MQTIETQRRTILIGVLAARGYAIPGLQNSPTADLEAELALIHARDEARGCGPDCGPDCPECCLLPN